MELETAGIRWTVGTGRGDDFLWRRSIDLPDRSWLGVGMYRVRVITQTEDGRCLAKSLLDVGGRHPLTTVAGAAGLLAAAGGVAAVGLILLRGAGPKLRTRRTFEASEPFADFEGVITPGDYVGWAEVACDTGARTFLNAPPPADVRAFLQRPATRDRIARLEARAVAFRVDDERALPRARWRPRLFVVAPVAATLGALGVLVLLQQFGVLHIYRDLALGTVGVTLAAAIIVSNLARFLAVVALNRRLGRAEAELDIEDTHEPRYGEDDDQLDTYAFSPTHVVPHGGLPAWGVPNRLRPEVARLDAGLPVRVTERQDDLARIVCSNGWTGWTESEPLQEIDRNTSA